MLHARKVLGGKNLSFAALRYTKLQVDASTQLKYSRRFRYLFHHEQET